MTRHPIDLPDDPRPSIGESYRLYPIPQPTEGEVLRSVARVIGIAAALVVAVLVWGLA